MSRPGPRWRRLGRSFYARDALELAPALLNRLVVAGARAGRIVEVEAYLGEQDPASHAFRGRSARNASMFGPPGLLYVYRSYGVHWCANVVSGAVGSGQAVLLRALEPVAGLPAMREVRALPRGVPADTELCRGPGRLSRALGIDGTWDGLDLTDPTAAAFLADDGVAPPAGAERSRRVGIRAGTEHLWRFSVPGHPAVSGPRRQVPPAGARAR